MPKKIWFVYMLRCKDKSLYTGMTTDPMRRANQHRDGKVKYTRGRMPVDLVYVEHKFCTRGTILKRENQIKKMSKQQKEKLVKEQGL